MTIGPGSVAGRCGLQSFRPRSASRRPRLGGGRSPWLSPRGIEDCECRADPKWRPPGRRRGVAGPLSRSAGEARRTRKDGDGAADRKSRGELSGGAGGRQARAAQAAQRRTGPVPGGGRRASACRLRRAPGRLLVEPFRGVCRWLLSHPVALVIRAAGDQEQVQLGAEKWTLSSCTRSFWKRMIIWA